MPGFFLPYLWDATYILVIIGALLALLASANVNYTYKKYSRITAERPLTGEMAAREILNAQGISLPIQSVAGHLTDHYDPRHKILNLSDTVRNDRSIASIGIALYALVLIFQLVTLPVEFNASRRAMAILSERNILMPHELPGARAVLRAAALTYVAAAAARFLQLLRLILIFGGGSRNRRS